MLGRIWARGVEPAHRLGSIEILSFNRIAWSFVESDAHLPIGRCGGLPTGIEPSPHRYRKCWQHKAVRYSQSFPPSSSYSVVLPLGKRGCRHPVPRHAIEPGQLRRTVDAANQPPPGQQEQAISHLLHQRAWCSSERRNSSSCKMLDVPLSGGWLIQHPRGNTPAGCS